MNLFTLPPDAPFLDTLAASWLARAGRTDPLAAARGLILLPTRRAARAMADAFLRASDGAALLLPRIAALGALDEAPLVLAGALDLPPAIDPALRLALLARLILGMGGANGAPRSADRAWALAEELAALMDEAERAEIDLAASLPEAADPAFAAHWAQTVSFLRIVTATWPALLAELGAANPAARAGALLNAQAAAWAQTPPEEPIWLAGTTAAIPAVARLARAIALAPLGAVILPGLDLDLPEDAWAALGPEHPQAGLRRLLERLDATRGDVRVWPGASGARPARVTLLRQALLPGAALGAWQRRDARAVAAQAAAAPPPAAAALTVMAGLDPAIHPRTRVPDAGGGAAQMAGSSPAMTGGPAAAVGDGPVAAIGAAIGGGAATAGAAPPAQLWRLDPADPQEESFAIALILRDALDRPGARAALVTPDRALAGRVAAALLRFGVIADDSAGEKLTDTPPAVFLRLLAAAMAGQLAPVPLLALLKHPLAAAGLAPAACRAATRAMEVAFLRGPRPAPGMTGLRRAIAGLADPDPHAAFLARIETALAPALRVAANAGSAPAAALDALLAAAEALAATDAEPGAPRLWSGEDGAALAEYLAALRPAFAELPDQQRAVFPPLLDAALAGGPAVRTRRALRGRDGEEHPRVFIWGLLEARLQPAEVMVLGGLVEGVWPPAPEPGPWLSRPMRTRIGLPAPEEAVGQAAHDFAAAASAAATVVLSCPRRRDGAPAVPARWIARLEAYLAGRAGAPEDAALPLHPAVGWARALDQPDGPPRAAAAPAPRPPVALRPRRLSVTEIETWQRDPYAIYARRILRLEALDPLEQATDAADFGSLVHQGLEAFITTHGAVWPPDAAKLLRAALLGALARAPAVRPALANWWAPRLVRIADWVAARERDRRALGLLTAARAEALGRWILTRPGGDFTLTGKADRIERWSDGFVLLDYKTGSVASQAEVAAGLAPQLPLEATMLEAGAFGPDWRGTARALEYWRLTGGQEQGKATVLFADKAEQLAAVVADAAAGLAGLIDAYDDPARAYLSQPHPGRAPRFATYAQLARVAERAAAGE